VLGGCASAIEGTPARRQATGLQTVLPTPEQVNQAVGNRLDPTGPAAVGSIDLLPNGIRDGSQVTPAECLGPATPLMRAVYQTGDVTGVALRDFARFGEGLTVSSAHTGVVRFGSDAEAMRMFEGFVAQWRACEGVPVTVAITPTAALRWTVTDVRVDGTVLSATILSGETDQEPAFPTEHAVGVAADCIVDVDVAVTDVLASRRVAAGRAADLVRLMLENVDGLR
jgi:hypothetical protein